MGYILTSRTGCWCLLSLGGVIVVGMDAKQISVCVIFELSMHRCKCYGTPKVIAQVELAIDQRGSWI